MDDADRTDRDIEDTVTAGVARAKQALEMRQRQLLPITQEVDGVRFSLCHFCGSEIAPGHRFCPTDPIDPDESCVVLWEYTQTRKEANR